MNELIQLKEPRLLFRYNQKLEDPRDGLTLFGPIDDAQTPYGILSGVVGTPDGIRKFRKFVKQMQSPQFNTKTVERPFFPGFQAVFGIEWSEQRITEIELNTHEIHKHIYNKESHKRVYETVNYFTDKILKELKEENANMNVWFIIVPDEVYALCRPNSVVEKEFAITTNNPTRGRAKKFLTAPSLFEEDNLSAEPFKYDANFHHQIKARLLEHKIPTQIIRESTLAPEEFLDKYKQPIRDLAALKGHIAWSISTAVFYKAGGKPWKLADIRSDVCYVGLVYKKDDRGKNPRNACCAAQMFLTTGEGIVFKGAIGPYYNDKTGEFHLKKKDATTLIKLVIETYKSIHDGKPPKELFIHAKTSFDNIEWSGFKEELPEETNLVGVTIKEDGNFKLYKDDGRYAMLRGTAYLLDERAGYLWTKGFVPRLQTSLAMEIPNPFHIEITKGEASIRQVIEDVLALTKLNFNACLYGDGEPVTLRFADDIGNILTAAPIKDGEQPLFFKYYI